MTHLFRSPPAERRAALLAFLLFANFMVAYYLLKPVRDSLFNHYIGPERLPHAYATSILVTLLAMAAYNQLFMRVRKDVFLSLVIALVVGCILLFWLCHYFQLISPQVLGVSFFLWMSLFAVLNATLFWSVANDVFALETARNLYAFVGMGGIVGAGFGSWLTEQLIGRGWLLSEELLPIAAVLLCFIPFLIRVLRKVPGAKQASVPAETIRHREGWLAIIRERYVAAMAGLVFLMTFIGAFLMIKYNHILTAALADKEAKTHYFAFINTRINLVALLIQLLVTRPVHRYLGPIPGLLVLPAIGIFAVVVLVTSPTLQSITLPWIAGLATMYSINQSSKELLYIPTPDDVKYGAKGYIDVFFFRLGDGSAALLMIIFPVSTNQGNSLLITCCSAAILIWFAIIALLRQEYRQRVR